jgi:hypothetical protein
VTHLLAILGLGAACALFYLVQRGAGATDDPACPEADADCGGCALGGARENREKLKRVPGAADQPACSR